MLPPSPSAPRSFDSSAYSSPHLQTPSSANSNTGGCLSGQFGFGINSATYWLTHSVFLTPPRAHITWRFGTGAGSRKWAAKHESEPGSILGQITVNNRQLLPASITKAEGKQGHVKLKKKKESVKCQHGGTRFLRKHRTELRVEGPR